MNETVDPLDLCLTWYKYLRQGKTWVPKDRPPLPIAEMDATWRYNAANWLLRQASSLAMRYGFGELQHVFGATVPTVGPFKGAKVSVFESMGEMSQDALERAMERDQEARDADPKGWLKSTPLYQALVDDLPDNVADLARHWSTCDLRTGEGSVCSCWRRHLTECPVYDSRDITATCHCRDNSPEWTL